MQRRVGADEAGLDERAEPGQEHRDGAVRDAQAPAQRQQQELEHVMSTSCCATIMQHEEGLQHARDEQVQQRSGRPARGLHAARLYLLTYLLTTSVQFCVCLTSVCFLGQGTDFIYYVVYGRPKSAAMAALFGMAAVVPQSCV